MKLKKLLESENLEDFDFDRLVSLNNEWSDENDSGFYVCYKDEFDDYKDLIDSNKPVNSLKTSLKDVFWIDNNGKLHTDTIEGARKKIIKVLSSKKARSFLGL